MSFNDDYLKLRKKRLEEEESRSNNTPPNTSVYFDTLFPDANSDIAPVRKTTQQPTTTDERKWFEKGAFEDGYQFGDFTKTTEATFADLRTNLISGIIGIPETVIDVGAYIVGGVGGLFSKDFQESTKDFIAKDLYDEEAVAKAIVRGTTPSSWFDKSMVDEKNSALGEKTDSLVQSGGQLLGTVALQSVGVPWYLTTGVTSFGSEAENAFNQDATYGQAGLSAAINAGVELATEKLFGGSGLGEKGLINLDGLTKGISNKVGKALLDFGIDITGEGLEEVASQIGSNFASALYREENLQELLLSEEAFDEYLESFIGGMALSGGANVGKVGNSIKTGRDYRTGLTESEQKVFDNVYNKRVAEAQEGGKELSKKEKDAIYDSVMNDLEKGYINTDTIEEVLGEDVYKSYKDTIDYEDDILKQFEELGNKTNPTLAEQSLYAELKSQADGIKQNSQREEIKSRLSEEVFGKVKDTKLAESYNERARRGQHFEADLSQYDEKQQDHVKRAMESGVLNNTNRTRELIALGAKIEADKGVRIHYVNDAKLKEMGIEFDGADTNGFVKDGELYINVDSKKYLNFVVGHEITHTMKVDKKLYADMQRALFDVANSKGEYDSRLKEVTETYKKYDPNADPKEELTADLVGDYLFTDEDFVKRLSTEHRNVFQKVWDEIKHLWKMATAGSKEARELEKAMHLFEKVYKESGKASDGTKYSLGETTDGRFVAVVDSDILSNIDTTSWDKSKKAEAKKAASEALKKFSGGIVVDGITRKVNKQSRNEYTRSDYTEGLYNKDPDVFADKMRAADVADDIVVATTNWSRDGGLTHPRNDKFVDFDHGKTLIASGNAKYSAEVVVGITNDGEAVFYDVVDMTPTTFDIKKAKSPTAATTQNAIGDIHEDFVDDIIPQNSEKSSGFGKFSLSEADNDYISAVESGDTETAQRLVDDAAKEAGYTIKAYHGSRKVFNEFSKEKRGTNTHTQVSNQWFFAADKETANSYYPYGVMKELQKQHPEWKWANPETLKEKGKLYHLYLKMENPLVVDVADYDYAAHQENKDAWMEYVHQAEINGNDGIVLLNAMDNQLKTSARESTVYMFRDSNQAKSADTVTYDDNGNVIPLSERFNSKDNDIRFSLSKSVEETKDLIAMHNVSEAKLQEALKLGGLPSPSVAITKKDIAHDNYGGITLLLQKDAIDPQADSRNKVYGSDAWTPTISNARTEYEIDFEKMRAFEKKLAELGKKTAGGTYSSDSLVRRLGIEDVSEQNVAQLAERLAKHDEVRAAYLAEMGQTIEPEYKEKVYNKYGNKALQTFIDTVGVERLATLAAESELGNTDAIRAEEETVRKIIRDTHAERNSAYLKRRPEMKEKLLDAYMEKVSFFTIEDFVNNAWQFYQEGGAVTEEVDRLATSDKLRQAVSDADVRAWLEPQIEEFFGEPGIYNGKDPFTADGRSRSFAETHYTYTAENIVKAMQNAAARGVGTFGANANSIIATATPSYNSIEEMHANKGRLKVEDQETYDAILSDIDKALNDVEHDIMRTTKHHADNTFDEEQIIGSIITEAATGTRTVSAVKRAFAKEGYTITTEQAQKVLALYNKAANVPTGYFEAKPERVVGFNEVAAFIIPNNTDVKLKQQLLNAGYNIAEYDPNVEGDRKRVVNQFEEYTFSLSDVNAPQKRYGNYNIYGKDVRFEAPVQEEVAPMQETVSKTETVEDYAPDEFAPIPEAEANAMQSENIAHLDDADVPPEMEAPYYGETQDAAPIDPFGDRDMKEVSRDRKTPAYMYENPEVKPFFQAEANILLGELERVEKPETIYNGWAKYEMSYEFAQDIPEIYRTERMASDTIVYLRDTIGMSYADIEKGLKAIIEDHGAENIAAAKKLEFVINDRLLYGYNDDGGFEIPANQEYINLLTEKQIREYSEEARKQFFDVADAYDPMADIAPVAENKAAPVKEKYEAIKPPKQTKEPSMKRVKDADDIAPTENKTAEIYDIEPDTGKKKSRGWARFRANFLDKQSVFEDLALKTNNRELMGKANYILSAEQRAQRLIGNGKSSAGVKSLNDIRAEVESTGKTKQFYEYLYHRHNIDRMSLEESKPVFGDSVTADVSRAAVSKYEATDPKFKEYAQDVYDYMNYLRDQMVESGVISQETANLWAQMYPHYVPIRRLGDTGLNINVPLDTGRTGVNAPIKKATGGSRDILPLFDTIALRTEQTYKAIAKNNFGVELKNTLGSTVESSEANIDEMIDSVDAHEELLKKGENGKKPTFTVFEDGKKVTFEITEDMYDALKPTSDDLRYTNKVANTISNVHRGLLTEYNPTFMLTNAIKDVQDVLINSQHPAKTYANMPNAIMQMAKNGSWYQEYLENGGESNTYFDGQSNTFTKDDTGIKKIIGMPLRAISAANNYVERAPRLAEYIASRKAGASAEVAMLDAARVTTNFAAGGDVTKWANRNGFTFLNASVQGAMQQVRNVREAKANGLKGWVQLATKVAIAGIPAMILNNLLWDDDEEYEQLSDYVKDNYYVVAKYGDGKFVRIPKGRALAVIQDALEQVGNALTGNDEVDLANFLELTISNLAPTNPLDNNILAPIGQALSNKTWYGEDLVPTRLQDLPAAEQFDESTDSISKWLGEKLNISPYKLNYLLNQYSGGVGDVVLPMLTPEAESGDNSLIGNMIAPLRDKFTTDSVMNNQNVSDFYDTVDKLTANAKSSYATDEDILKSKYMNSVNAELSELYKQKREIQNSNLSDAKKYEAVRDIQKQIDTLAEESLNTYGNVNIDGGYAVVGDRYYKLNDNGEWVKITDKQLEKQEDVTSGLGIDPSTYWENKSEYDFAYEYPEKYALAKSVGGYESYKTYTSDLYDIKADKDENGKSISGSRKDKVADYINGLDISYEEKIILFKSEYNADDTYNYEIIEYLNNRNDISYEEMVAILKELGFTVKGDTITWD